MAEEGEIEVKVTADGVAETAKEFDALAVSMTKAAKAQELIAKTSAQIQRRNVLDAIKREAAAVNELTSSIEKNEKATANVSKQIATFRQGLGPAAALIGTLGNSFSQLAPQATGAMGAMQKFVSAMNQAMALAGTGGAIAGPYGAVAGGIVGLISGMASAMGAAKKEADELAKATLENAKALGDYTDQIARLQSQVASKYDQKKGLKTAAADLAKGKGSSDDYQKAILTQQARLDNPYYRDMYIDAAKADKKDPGSGDALLKKRSEEANYIRGEIERYRRWLSDVEGQSAAAASNAQTKFDTEGDIVAAGGVPSDAKKDKGKTQIELDTERIRAMRGDVSNETQWSMEQGGMQGRLEDRTADKMLGQLAGEEQRRKNDLELFKKTSDAQEKIIEERTKKEVALEKQKADAIQQIREQETGAAMAASQMVTGAALKGISEVIKGKKVEAGAILESLGDQFVAAGTGLIFTGLGISANPFTPGAGAGMIGIGAAEVAFGLGLGAAGANMPGGSNAGGGGSAAPAPTAANDPYRNTFTPPNQGPTIINLNFPTVLSPSAVDGARMESALRQAKRVYG